MKGTANNASNTRKALVAIMLLSLLMQVQSVFACQMMDHSGPIEECCCENMAAASIERSDLKDSNEGDACCEIEANLSLKELDLEDDAAVISKINSSAELPIGALIFLVTTLWPELGSTDSNDRGWSFESDPSNPGTSTYLSTQRLRI
ncbi:hypothetical protein [Alteromonas macleodii]|uniref:hypothetical protein n=1 Tax=Alteromonas macleodii TaxID=28108 RepID=UPI00085943B3|nr:hypothetical protein [Alteromonas macleodii]